MNRYKVNKDQTGLETESNMAEIAETVWATFTIADGAQDGKISPRQNKSS